MATTLIISWVFHGLPSTNLPYPWFFLSLLLTLHLQGFSSMYHYNAQVVLDDH